MLTPYVVDFETEAIDESHPHLAPKPVGVAIRYLDGKCKYYAWGHPWGNDSSYEIAKSELQKVWDSDEQVLFHNAKFDLGVAYKWFGLPKLDKFRIEDTLFLLFLKYPHSKSLSLKPASQEILGMPPDERDAVADWLRNYRIIATTQAPGAFICRAPGSIVRPYAIGDVDRTFRLWEKITPQLDDREREAYDRERRLLPILMENEAQGMRVDLGGLEQAKKTYTLAVCATDVWLRTKLGVPGLNLDSDKEVAAALKKSGVVSKFKPTPTGLDSVSKKNSRLDPSPIWLLRPYRRLPSGKKFR